MINSYMKYTSAWIPVNNGHIFRVYNKDILILIAININYHNNNNNKNGAYHGNITQQPIK